jgi:hypothetical protein
METVMKEQPSHKAPKSQPVETSSSATRRHLDELLDEALEETFPASDPQAINVEQQRPSH